MSTEDPKAMLRRATAAADRRDPDHATTLLRQLIADHPNSAEASVARTALQDLQSVTPSQRVGLVRVVDIDIGLFTMVGLFLKAAIAIVPALFLAAIFWTVISGTVLTLLAGISR